MQKLQKTKAVLCTVYATNFAVGELKLYQQKGNGLEENKMTERELMLSIRLFTRIQRNPEYAKKIGLSWHTRGESKNVLHSNGHGVEPSKAKKQNDN